jgi:hypothetical protein
MVEYRLVVKLQEGFFEVWREKKDDHGHVTSSLIYTSENHEKLPYSNMSKVLKSITSELRDMGMNVNNPDVKKLFIRDTFQLYHEDLNESSDLEEIHKLIPKPLIFDTTWDRWQKLSSQEKQQILKQFHAYYQKIDAKFDKRATLSLPVPSSKRPIDRSEANQMVEEAASKSVDSSNFRKSIMAILATLAAAGIKNYWPFIRKQIKEWKKRASPQVSTSSRIKSKSATRKSSSRREAKKIKHKKSVRKSRK